MSFRHRDGNKWCSAGCSMIGAQDSFTQPSLCSLTLPGKLTHTPPPPHTHTHTHTHRTLGLLFAVHDFTCLLGMADRDGHEAAGQQAGLSA